MPTVVGLLLLIHTFSVLSLQLKKLGLSNADPARGHKEVRRSTGHIMGTARYSNQHRDPNSDKILARSNQPRTSKNYRRQHEVFGYELQFLLSGVLSVFQNLK